MTLLRFKVDGILRILCLVVVDIGVHEMCLVFNIAAVIVTQGLDLEPGRAN